jgi:DNA-binding NarL/FixJ family response regulator
MGGMTNSTAPTTLAPEAALQRNSGDPPTSRLRVLVADDHPLVLDGLVRALRVDVRFEVVGQAADGRDAVTLAEELAPDLAVLDVRMPILDGVRALEQIAEHVPRTRVVLLSAFDDDVVIRSAMAAGAAGYLIKDTDRVAICDALARAGAGETVGPVPEHERPRAPAPPELTLRERNVLLLARDDWDDDMIAMLLDIEPGDVDWYIDCVAAKLGAEDRAGTIHAARAWGLLP